MILTFSTPKNLFLLTLKLSTLMISSLARSTTINCCVLGRRRAPPRQRRRRSPAEGARRVSAPPFVSVCVAITQRHTFFLLWRVRAERLRRRAGGPAAVRPRSTLVIVRSAPASQDTARAERSVRRMDAAARSSAGNVSARCGLCFN